MMRSSSRTTRGAVSELSGIRARHSRVKSSTSQYAEAPAVHQRVHDKVERPALTLHGRVSQEASWDRPRSFCGAWIEAYGEACLASPVPPPDGRGCRE